MQSRLLILGVAALLQVTARASVGLSVPSIIATAKGPNQINLAWPAVSNPGYGYLIEVQSAADARYSSWKELAPIPPAGGYTCNSTILINGASCTTSDPTGIHVYNPPTNGVPYWVTEAQYIDPQDGTAAQFIAAGLLPNTAYTFRVRTYSAIGGMTYGPYSNSATATTANYPVKYVSTAGNDANDGSAPDSGHAWRTIGHGSTMLACGQELIVMGGNYTLDHLQINQSCTAAAKAVVMVNPGDAATITSSTSDPPIQISGSHIVLDGIKSGIGGPMYQMDVSGDHHAFFNLEIYQPVVPTLTNGIDLRGGNSLVYHCYLHDASSPEISQNPSLGNGWVLTLQGAAAVNNVVWSNHLTRSGHDSSLCKTNCQNNRWLNNIMDGGWSMGWEAIELSTGNLVEGNVIKDPGQLTAAYKPGLEISSANNTVRRNVILNAKSYAVEVSAIEGIDTVVSSHIYNNTFLHPGACLYEASNGGPAKYSDLLFSNNICYKTAQADSGFGIMYSSNPASQVSYNSVEYVDASDVLQTGVNLVHYYGGSPYSTTLAIADTDPSYSPPFSKNLALSAVRPQFVDEANGDLHLNVSSPLRGAGVAITDGVWGSTQGYVDLGAFGMGPAPSGGGAPPPPPTPGPVTATPVKVVVTGSTATFDGTPKAVSLTVTPAAAASVVVLTYTSASPSYNSTAAPSNAGTYTATATLNNSNYALTSDSIASGTLTIMQPTPTPTPTPAPPPAPAPPPPPTPTPAPPPSWTPTPTPTSTFTPIRVNAGGSAYTDSQGRLWSADYGYSGSGGTFTASGSIAGTTDMPLYQSERWTYPGALAYNFTAPAGTYTVNLKFAENFATGPGQRSFNIVINGQTCASNYDIFAQAGGAGQAVDKQCTVSSTGTISIQFNPVVGGPKVNAIEIF